MQTIIDNLFLITRPNCHYRGNSWSNLTLWGSGTSRMKPRWKPREFLLDTFFMRVQQNRYQGRARSLLLRLRVGKWLTKSVFDDEAKSKLFFEQDINSYKTRILIWYYYVCTKMLSAGISDQAGGLRSRFSFKNSIYLNICMCILFFNSCFMSMCNPVGYDRPSLCFLCTCLVWRPPFYGLFCICSS